MYARALPAVYSENGLARYLQEINKFPLLSEELESSIALRWYERGDLKAAHQLVTSHLRLVVKIALKFSGYGLPMLDIISEGNLGLMKAVRKFNPGLKNRFSTYAMWWIKAYIQDYILKGWSCVKTGSSKAKKKLFYNFNKVKNKLLGDSRVSDNMACAQVEDIAKQLDVSKREVVAMDGLMRSKYQKSLNEVVYEDGETELLDLISDPRPNQEVLLVEEDDIERKRGMLYTAFEKLTERERDVITERRLREKPTTCDRLGAKYGISSERVRQIERRAFEKLQSSVVSKYNSINLH